MADDIAEQAEPSKAISPNLSFHIETNDPNRLSVGGGLHPSPSDEPVEKVAPEEVAIQQLNEDKENMKETQRINLDRSRIPPEAFRTSAKTSYEFEANLRNRIRQGEDIYNPATYTSKTKTKPE